MMYWPFAKLNETRPPLSEIFVSFLSESVRLTTFTVAKTTGSFFELTILKVTGISCARTQV